MVVYINSKLKEIPDEINTVGKLMAYLQIPSAGTGVGVNNHVVSTRNWDSTPVKEEDRIMIISATYGG